MLQLNSNTRTKKLLKGKDKTIVSGLMCVSTVTGGREWIDVCQCSDRWQGMD